MEQTKPNQMIHLNAPVVLASGSPRRHEILSHAGITHEVFTADADEHSILFEKGKPGEYVEAIASLKNDATCERIRKERPDLTNALVISADTVVYFPDTSVVLGKPANEAEAIQMLHALSGKTHKVLTGVVVRSLKDGRVVKFHEVTDVRFRKLDDREIAWYVGTGDPLDKAGAYGLQNGASMFVEAISGDYFNVIGLPVCRLSVVLNRFAE